MIPYTTLQAFHDEDMLPSAWASTFSPNLFQTDPCEEDCATFDLDDMFPDEQLDKAEYIEEDYEEDIHYADTAENEVVYIKQQWYPSCKSAYIEDFEEGIHYGDTPEKSFTPLKKFLYQNCKWTGCDAECAKTHSADIPSEPFSDISLDHPNVVEPSQLFAKEEDKDNNDNDDSCDEAYITDAGSVQPYTPDSDHCYSQPLHMRYVSEESDRTVQDSVDSDTSETSDDEVDVVTVTEEYVRPVQRFVGKPYRAPKRKYTSRRSSRTRNAVSVKAAATALKRTRYQSRVPAKRRKLLNSVETSPSSSLPSSSCDNSRCNSDIEDYEKRSTHNDSERKRREAQRTALQMLRICIPELQSNTKAPKVLILNTATNLVRKLEREAEQLQEQAQIELKRRRRFQERLKQLIAK